MKIKVITLKSAEKRKNKFIERNKHIKYEFVDAVVGKELSEEIYYDKSLINWNNLRYTPGAIGNALSHLKLWNEVIEKNTPMTILEDDAATHYDFYDKQKEVMKNLPEDWDIITWGYNFDAILCIKIATGNVYINHVEPRESFDEEKLIGYQSQEINPELYKTQVYWGLCGYSISPKGAKLYKEKCFPLTDFIMSFADKMISNQGLDTSMVKVHSESKSYFCFPTIVYNQNIETDVWPNKT
jgi:GR25 family glycosyltransferase involved in LPS biosynthesis